jgi:hypothetical protein
MLSLFTLSGKIGKMSLTVTQGAQYRHPRLFMGARFRLRDITKTLKEFDNATVSSAAS